MKTYTMKEGHSAGKTNMTSSIPKKKKKDVKVQEWNDEQDEKQGYNPKEKEATMKKVDKF